MEYHLPSGATVSETSKTVPEPRIVTPQEAQQLVDNETWMRNVSETSRDLAHTVATEPERTRAAVFKALHRQAKVLTSVGEHAAADIVHEDAAAIENGADW